MHWRQPAPQSIPLRWVSVMSSGSQIGETCLATRSVQRLRKPLGQLTASKDCAGSWAQEVMVLRSRILVVLLVSTCILSGVAVSVPVAVRYRAGLIHGFLILSKLDGEALAAGDLTQVARGDQVTTQLVFRFKDGSRQEETTVFSQRGNFRLVSYHMVQKGPSFKNASDLTVTCATG
jgi:hypothetical protein